MSAAQRSQLEDYDAMRERVYGHKPQVHREAGGTLELPPARSRTFDDVEWGFMEDVGSVAFWAAMAWRERDKPWWHEAQIRLGETVAEEVVACLLCGYGVTGELGVAMFERLKSRSLAGGRPDEKKIFAALDEPVAVGDRSVRYRFPAQKARYIAAALARFAVETPPDELLALREYLRGFAGIGWKTASFIVRNLGCDDVAVLDVHLVRGCVLAGVFPEGADPARDYPGLERRFLAFARAIGARPSRLDALMWSEMRSMPSVFRPARAKA